MNTRHIVPSGVFCLLLAGLMPQSMAENNWPQWRGVKRDGHSADTGLLDKWPENGPEKIWMFENAGKGYSGPAIVGGNFFTMGTRDNRTIILCLDANTGEEQWVKEIGTVLGNAWGDGPRGTPAVDGDNVYTLTGEGNLSCVAAVDGSIL